MGGTVGIEAARMEELDYETVKASGLAFGTAHNVLQRSLTKSKSVNVSNDQTTIHFLAIRQLSHNLKNQKVLEKTHKKVIKTKSVPHNVKYKQHSSERDLLDVDQEHEHEQELDHDDLHLVHDEEYYAHHDNFHSQIVDDGPPWSFSEKNGFHAHDYDEGQPRVNQNHAPHALNDVSSNRASTDNTTTTSSVTTTTSKAPVASTAKQKKARPNLSLQLTSDVSNNALPVDSTINNGTGFQPHKLAQVRQYQNGHHEDTAEVGVVTASGQPLKHPPSPSANVRVSPRGTLYMGKWKVMETGIFPDESAHAQSLRNKVHHQGSIGSHLNKSHTYSRGLGSSSSNLQRTGSLANSSIRRPVPLPAIGGKRDFLEINTLGSGASGVVTEAIHLPSLTIVALKMLPVYNQEKRQHVSRELGVLYKNLAELRLVDDSLYEDKSADQQQQEKQQKEGGGGGAVGGLGGTSSPHILSLYNAFVDPKSGMINLVIEYMDGGSLEDLVQQGGCRDEKVLADIAYQTIKGLCFLHSHKSVHRDIKPANILCSTSGLIKIGDFGISKALDKTTGFANSFVGTVSYMSPERITGEHYSFSSDIWSLGLTILAVAKGRFPLSSHGNDSDGDSGTLSEKSSPLQQKVVGGAAGYWAMIKAICDDEPPVAGPFFSAEFNSFIANCLQKDPAARSSAKGLLSLPFIENNTSSLKLSYSDIQMRNRNLSPDSTNLINATTSAIATADAKVPLGGAARTSGSPVKLEVDVNCSPAEGNSVPPAPSPLTTRLTNAAIVRRTSLDVPVFDSPTNLMHKAITEAEHKAALESNSGKDATFGNNPHLVNGTIREDVEEDNDGEDMQYIDGAQRAVDVINAIRLEHLDRVLDRIAHKLGMRSRRAHSADGDEEGEGEDDEYDDTQDRDLADIHHYVDDFATAKDEMLLGETNSSLDSLDRMLQHKASASVAATAEPSPPPTLMLPAHKFNAKKQAAMAEASPEVDQMADAKPESAVAEAKLNGHKGVKGVSPNLSPESKIRMNDIKKVPAESSSGDEKSPLHHSILKGTASYNASHPVGSHHPPLHAIVSNTHTDSPVAADDGLMRAEDKKAIFVAHKARSSGSTAFNSNRSVHFIGEDDPLLGTKKATLTHHQRPSFVLEGDGEVESGEAEREERDRERERVAESDGSHPHLPKTSSYFVQSRSQPSSQNHDGETNHKGEAKSEEGDNRTVVEKAIAVSEAVSQACDDAPPALPVDYRRMLPKLNSRGLPKWENLARQLHLPLHLVKLAVRSRLGDLVNLEDEEEEEEGEEGEEEEYELEGNGGAGLGRAINALIEDERELLSERDSPSEEHPLEAAEQQSGSHHK